MGWLLGWMTCLGWVLGGAEAQSPCDLELVEPSGLFSTPNYPDNYDDGLECKYTINVSSGNQILLEFQDFQVEPEAACSFDRVEVYSPTTGNTDVYCGFSAPPPILESGNVLEVTFVSDGSNNFRGFLAEYVSEPVANCGDWETFEGNCYWFSEDNLQQSDAEDACVAMGGHLVSIHSLEENFFVGKDIPFFTRTISERNFEPRSLRSQASLVSGLQLRSAGRRPLKGWIPNS